ncbi:transcription repressor NadR [Pueribacillus theae]|uniref:Transcription repressor NadR n=1 Tax=Pueribacillus theae TaxID=2171751 RepID=A0A2U1K0L5_9BACI|nr:transcription repressor NadR [Pueribacillus theae]PWA10719.1 transcription repressor NadR [Pueribacillus theae]
MKGNKEKILGDERRALILKWLKEEGKPITGSALAKRTNVSRQVIVQDISLLKAKNEPIVATAQGYLYMEQPPAKPPFQWVIAVKHKPEDTRKELEILVDHGVTVRDATIEHPVYGDLTGSLMISSRRDVDLFIKKMKSAKASLLSELTDGVHMHTLDAENEEQLQEACHALEKAGFLLRQND